MFRLPLYRPLMSGALSLGLGAMSYASLPLAQTQSQQPAGAPAQEAASRATQLPAANHGAASRQPFSVEHLVRLKRVSEPTLSPDGKTVVFTVRATDMDANRGRTDLWSLDLATKDAQPRRLTSSP